MDVRDYPMQYVTCSQSTRRAGEFWLELSTRVPARVGTVSSLPLGAPSLLFSRLTEDLLIL